MFYTDKRVGLTQNTKGSSQALSSVWIQIKLLASQAHQCCIFVLRWQALKTHHGCLELHGCVTVIYEQEMCPEV